jgi:hypothetical protein
MKVPKITVKELMNLKQTAEKGSKSIKQQQRLIEKHVTNKKTYRKV